MDGRKLEAGDVIQCHGAVDMLWMALILRSQGYRVVRGETVGKLLQRGTGIFCGRSGGQGHLRP